MHDIEFLGIVSILAPLHNLLVLKLWKQIEIAFQQLDKDDLLATTHVQALIPTYNRLFNDRRVNALFFLISPAIAYWLVLTRSHHLNWWGAPTTSYGFLAAMFIASIIWYQLLEHNYKGIIAIGLLRSVLKCGLRLQPLHPDGVYGLGVTAEIILLAYGSTVVHCLAVLTLWHGQFLTAREPAVVIFIGLFFIIFVPMFFAFPSIAFRRQIAYFKSQLREAAKAALSMEHRVATVGSAGQSASLVSSAAPAFEAVAASAIQSLPNHPFSSRVIVLSACGYMLQVVSAVVTIWQALAKK